MIPRNMKSRDMVGMEVRTAREIMNGAGIVVPKGTKVKIAGLGRAFNIETERCPYCSLSAYITGVTRDEVELIPENYKKMTNADRIRTMTNEELADFLCKVKADYQWSEQEFPSEDASGDWEEWLESECDMG